MEDIILFKIKKGLCLLSIIFILLIVVPSSFAHENVTEVMIDDESPNPLEINEDAEIIKDTSKDYYFNASAADDSGNGSRDNPYKYLTADRIKANANIYLANGEYNLDKAKSIDQVNFIGSDANQTIIRYNGVAFNVWNSLTLTNLTISDATIRNYATLNATNTIFAHGFGRNPDSYGNNFGGAIYCPHYSGYTSAVTINNCTFLDNYAEYGGAIYMDGGSLDIIDTMFINNFAYNFGGTIATEYGTKVTVSRSKFYNSYSMADAGGAIYVRGSELKLNNVEITNSSATFGGAVASLNTQVSLNNLKVNDCSAKWDGGAVYHMYGNFTSYYGTFINNSANNGGALFIDNSTSFILRNNQFTNNNANLTAGAVYSICNTLKGMSSVKQYNRFTGNKAFFKNDEYEISSINLRIGNGNYTMYINNASEVVDLPSYYSLRDYNLLTIPKDQQSSGNCWAFTAIAVLESTILKAGGEYLDLSEENMKNVIAQFSDYGWDMETNEGGYDAMPIGYLVSWLGPIYDSEDVFDDHGTLSPILNSLMHVQNVVYLKRDNYLDNDAIKKAIMQYGAVGTSMLYDGNFFRGKGYYCWSTSSSNHAVTIVGWDDNYSRDNFYGLPQDKGDGAWIVRNSWGPNWKDNGYFYVSYYDEKLAQPGKDNVAYTFILNDTIKYDKNYQYDIAGKTDFYYKAADAVWYKNRFQAETDEFLAGISTYFEKVTNWTASVYVNGVLKAVTEGISNPGYYTFDLGKLIALNSGDEFEVEFKVIGSDVVSFPVSEAVSLNKEIYKPGISFVSLDGVNWTDLYDYPGSYSTHTYASQVACIKAFTILNEIDTITGLVIDYDGYNPVRITATVIDQYGNLLNNGNITFNLSGNEFVVDVSKGMAKITTVFEEYGLNFISATFNGIGYKSSTDFREIFVQSITVLSADDLVMSYRDGSAWTVTLTDGIGNPISNAGVKIGVSGRIYTVKTDANGVAKLVINLNPGNYAINATFESDVYDYSFVNATVTVNKAASYLDGSDLVMTYRDGSAWSVTLTDANGNAISGVSVKMGINGAAYNRVTDNNGVASLIVNLAPGTYAVNASFANNKYLSSSVSATVTVNKAASYLDGSDLVMTYRDGSAWSVTLTDAYGNAISGVSVKMGINGATYNRVTDADGVASLTVNLAPGTYAVNASFVNNKYLSSSLSTIVTVNKATPSLTAEDLVMFYRDGSSYNATLKDNNGNAMANTAIKFTINGKTYSAKTDANGVASLPINLKEGTYGISARYGGDYRFNSTVVNSTITVMQSTISIVANDVNMIYKDGSSYDVQLVDGNGNALAISNEVVKITIKGITYNVRTNADGIASLPINLLAGHYDISAQYGNTTINNTITVNNAN